MITVCLLYNSKLPHVQKFNLACQSMKMNVEHQLTISTRQGYEVICVDLSLRVTGLLINRGKQWFSM